MELPQEIEIWYVVPVLRKLLVAELKKKDLKQKEIAKILGLTEATLSHYAKDKRAACCDDAFKTPVFRSEIERSAELILSDRSPAVAMKEINRLCRFMREKKMLCDIHRKQNPDIKSCDICY